MRKALDLHPESPLTSNAPTTCSSAKGSKDSQGTAATNPPRARQTRHAAVRFKEENYRAKKGHTADALSLRFSERPGRKSSLEFLATDPSRTSFRDPYPSRPTNLNMWCRKSVENHPKNRPKQEPEK